MQPVSCFKHFCVHGKYSQVARSYTAVENIEDNNKAAAAPWLYLSFVAVSTGF